jgi:hypothetical protein
MRNSTVFQHLKAHGQLLDAEIAAALGISLAEVQAILLSLSTRGEISMCTVTRFDQGQPVTGMLCRVLGTIPKGTPGKKPKSMMESEE